MKRIAPLYVDHFGWATTKEPEVIAFFEGLGFYMGDKRKEGDTSFYMSHFYMDEGSAYINIYQLPEDGNMWPCKLDWIMDPSMPIEERLSDPAGVPGVYTFALSTGDCDASYAAAVKAGYKVSRVYRRSDSPDSDTRAEPGYYEKMGGSATSDMFAFKLRTEPFPNMMVGADEHCDEFHRHLHRKDIHEYHPNGVTKIAALTMYYETEEQLMAALKAIHKLHDTMRYSCDTSGYYTETMQLMDKKAYEKEFGVAAPTDNRSNVVGVTFQNGDLDYIREAAQEKGYTFFERDGKLYVDGRALLGAWLIFE